MSDFETKMRREINQLPTALQELLDNADAEIGPIAQAAKEKNANLICTIARGSSDHAAAYLKYTFEITFGVPVVSLGPSVNSIYGQVLNLDRSLCLAISQSGASLDIVGAAKAAAETGALTVAVTNTPGSRLSTVCQHSINIHAGLEESVAATKTFVSSIVAGLLLLAQWTDDQGLFNALRRLPEQMQRGIGKDWGALETSLRSKDQLFVLGRGPALAIAQEAALKFKETCQLHGEAYSSAEVLHGPVSVLSNEFPVLAMVARDQAEESIATVCDKLVNQSVPVFATSDRASGATCLPFEPTGHPLTDPLPLIVSFYSFVERLSRLRGLNPDTPRSLNKVTETV